MSEHEKDLLIIGLSILFVIFWGAFLGSQVLGVPLFVALFSALKSSWWGVVIFGSFGLSGLFYELTTIDRHLRIIESTFGKSNNPLAHRSAIGSSIGIVIGILLLSLPAYLLGSKDSVLTINYYLMIIGSVFLFLIVWMFVGAVIARIRRRRSL